MYSNLVVLDKNLLHRFTGKSKLFRTFGSQLGKWIWKLNECAFTITHKVNGINLVFFLHIESNHRLKISQNTLKELLEFYNLILLTNGFREC